MMPATVTELLEHGIAVTDGSEKGAEAGLLFCMRCQVPLEFDPEGLLSHFKSKGHRANCAQPTPNPWLPRWTSC